MVHFYYVECGRRGIPKLNIRRTDCWIEPGARVYRTRPQVADMGWYGQHSFLLYLFYCIRINAFTVRDYCFLIILPSKFHPCPQSYSAIPLFYNPYRRNCLMSEHSRQQTASRPYMRGSNGPITHRIPTGRSIGE